MLRTLTISALALLAGCATPIPPGRAPETTVLPAESAVVPSRWCGDYIIIDVMVNGFGPLALLLDTGSDTTVFDKSLADTLDEWVIVDPEIVRGAEGEELEITRQLRVESLAVGGLELGGFDAVLIDLGAISAALGEPIDGVIGFQSFYEVLLTVDYPGRQVRVARGTLSTADFATLQPMRGTRTPSVPIELQGQTLFALIDTAGTPALVLEDWSGFDLETPPVPIGTSVSIGGLNILERGRLGTDVRCGEHVFERPLFSPTSGGVKFGTDMLEPFAITFDQRARLVQFDRPQGESSPITSPAQRGLGVGFDRQADHWAVLRVFDNGPQGLREGDRVLAIDATPVDALGCGVFREMMATRERVSITLERAGRQIELDVSVRTLVP
ncbi:MAG: hypothetical protein Tsb0013_10230 [Phycisphaerales bacterium]